jgi:hypothetical protein
MSQRRASYPRIEDNEEIKIITKPLVYTKHHYPRLEDNPSQVYTLKNNVK